MTNAENVKVVEFRGVDNLYFAEVTTDNKEEYVTETPELLSAVAEIAKTTVVATETKYYDNCPSEVIRAEGSDTITLTIAVPSLETMAKLTGKQYVNGRLVDAPSVAPYFALGYRFKKTDGSYRFVWRLKGKFSTPDEGSATENEGTDTKNMTLIYTGIATKRSFDNGGKAKGIAIDAESKDDFFDSVVTPDTPLEEA